MNICLVSDNDVMEQFAFPGNINFAAHDQSLFSFIIHEMLLCLFIVCETMFAIVESRTRSTASACKSSPRKIFHWNSSGERRLKFIGQRIEEDNCEAERTSLSTAKATTLEKNIRPWDGLNDSWKLVKNFYWQVTYNNKYWMRLNRSVKFFKS